MKWVKHQLTREQADALYHIVERDNWPVERIARFQLFQNAHFVSPFYYVQCLKKAFGYGHFNHLWDKEARTRMIKEYLKTNTPPMCEEIRAMLGDEAGLVGL